MILHSKRVILALLTLALTSRAFAQTTAPAAPPSDVAVNIDPTQPAAPLSPDFAGLSVETQNLLPLPDGTHLFRPDNKPLLALFKTLGIHILRAGGYSADNSRIQVPTPADLDSFFTFAEAAKVKVIYTLRYDKDPSRDADTAKYIMDHYKADIITFEPGAFSYGQTYDAYKTRLDAVIAALKTPDCSPDISFAGPDTLPEQADWATHLANDFPAGGPVNMISQQAYFGGNAHVITTDAAATRAAMLSAGWLDQYKKTLDAFAPAAIAAKLPFRIDETSNFSGGGVEDVSNSHASALWALDYLHWWASHGAAGLNFHNGSGIADPARAATSWYSVFWASSDGYHPRPIAYALKAFDLASRGSSLPVKLFNPDNLNLTAYALLAEDKSLTLTLINKETGEQPKDANIKLFVEGYDPIDSLSLTADQNDLASTDTTTLSQARITDDGNWSGTWSPLTGNPITLPAATATLLHLKPR